MKSSSFDEIVSEIELRDPREWVRSRFGKYTPILPVTPVLGRGDTYLAEIAHPGFAYAVAQSGTRAYRNVETGEVLVGGRVPNIVPVLDADGEVTEVRLVLNGRETRLTEFDGEITDSYEPDGESRERTLHA
ncbi:hypothetical protein [Microbacterium sp. GXF6406]